MIVHGIEERLEVYCSSRESIIKVFVHVDVIIINRRTGEIHVPVK